MAITRIGPNQSINLASNVTGTLPAANVANSTLNNVTALPAAIPTGSMVKLQSTTISSSTASVSWNSTYITSTYDVYKLSVTNAFAVGDGREFEVGLSTDNF